MTSLDSFIRSVHRRWIIVRMIERAGIGLLGGCAVAGAMLPVQLWRGQPTLWMLLVSLTIGAVGGLIVGWLRRPDRFSAAVEADRQLDQSDLIATALLLRMAPSTDEWAAAVIASAERRCEGLSANAIVLHRLGSRSWGGIGLAAALLVTISLMFSQPTTSQGSRRAGNDVALPHHNKIIGDSPLYIKGAVPFNALESTRRASRQSEQGRGASDERSLTGANPIDDAGNTKSSADSSSQFGQSSGDAASGAGAGRSTPPDQPGPGIPAASASKDANTSAGDSSSGGAGKGAATVGSTDASGTASNVAASQRVPPWQHTTWPADRAEADQSLHDRSVPDAYRDIVREYFDPARQ